MAMVGKATATTLVALGLWAASAPAQDFGAKVFRLGDVPTVAADQQTEEDDTLLVHFRRGYGGYYGGYGGYYGGYNRGYYGGYRPYYSSYYYPRYSFSFGYNSYRPYYTNYSYGYNYNYYRPYYNNYYRSSYHYPISYGYYCPICLTTTSFGGSVGSYSSVTPQQPVEPMRKAEEFSVPQVPRAEEGTFPYDGGPSNPVPMPKADPLPQKGQPIDPTLGRVVSLPGRTTTFTYPAYGEKAGPTGLAQQPPVYIKIDPVQAARR